MTIDRRWFIKVTTAAGLALGAGTYPDFENV